MMTNCSSPAVSSTGHLAPAALAAARITQPWISERFARIDDDAGGAWPAWCRRVRFWASCRWHAAALETPLGLLGDPRLAPLEKHDPWVALRALRPYLRSGLGARQRSAGLTAHLQWFADHIGALAVRQLCDGEQLPLLPEGEDSPLPGLGLRLLAAGGVGLSREGELALQLDWEGRRLMTLAFSVGELHGLTGTAPGALPGARAVVGAMQGVYGGGSVQHAMSQAALGLHATSLLVAGLQGLSAGWRLESALCISRESHIDARHASRRHHITLDYDAAWKAACGHRAGPYYWCLPAHPVLRPESEVEPSQQVLHRGRNALRQGICDSVRAHAAALLADSAPKPVQG